MATIAINNLVGFDLLSDNETFLNDLSNDELASAVGGLAPIFAKTITLSTMPIRTLPIQPTPPVISEF